jgi:hypothetical protein
MPGFPLTTAVPCFAPPMAWRIVVALCAGMWVAGGGAVGLSTAQASCGDYLMPMHGVFRQAHDPHTPPDPVSSTHRSDLKVWPAEGHIPRCSGPMCGERPDRAPNPSAPVATRFVSSRDGQLLVAVTPAAIDPAGLSPWEWPTVDTGADRPGPAVPPPVATP